MAAKLFFSICEKCGRKFINHAKRDSETKSLCYSCITSDIRDKVKKTVEKHFHNKELFATGRIM